MGLFVNRTESFGGGEEIIQSFAKQFKWTLSKRVWISYFQISGESSAEVGGCLRGLRAEYSLVTWTVTQQKKKEMCWAAAAGTEIEVGGASWLLISRWCFGTLEPADAANRKVINFLLVRKNQHSASSASTQSASKHPPPPNVKLYPKGRKRPHESGFMSSQVFTCHMSEEPVLYGERSGWWRRIDPAKFWKLSFNLASLDEFANQF